MTLARTAFRQPVRESKPAKGPRAKKCASCRGEFMPPAAMVRWCSIECGLAVALKKLAAKKAKVAKTERAADKAKLAKLKSIPTLKAEAQIPFNEWVRLRDELAAEPCICCDKMPLGDGSLTGGAWDAAHYRSRGSADHLRFDERNVHRSLKDCNTYGHTDYRSGLIRRIGLAAVEALEADQALVKWTADYLLWVKAEYAARVIALKKGIDRPHQTYSGNRP